MTLSRPNDISPYMGCDPELFFKTDGKVIGAEKVLPEKGLVYTANSKIIIDGVQLELNPRPNYCRANLANEIREMFKLLAAELKKQGGKVTTDFSRTIEIDKERLMQLDEKSRKFGCAPSKTIYEQAAGIKIEDVNPEEYLVRAAGGHIHIGHGGTTHADKLGSGLFRALTKDYEKTVQMLDLIVGNTCVLIDRDAGNIERRKVYGKAGEFRLPAHGLEYRTLSNFWLMSYPLMSLAFGLTRLAVQLMSDTKHAEYYEAFTSKVKGENIKKAINNNDAKLALKNFTAIEPLIMQTSGNHDRYAIHKDNIEEFHYFVTVVNKKGLEYWFKQDPMTHWTTLPEAHRGGFADFLVTTVREDMKANKSKIAKLFDKVTGK